MSINSARIRERLSTGALRELFIEELGWDRHAATLDVLIEHKAVRLDALAHKRGMIAYKCTASTGQPLPDYSTRRKIEHQVAKSTLEHIIIFSTPESEKQIWQWVKREAGKPLAFREHLYQRSQTGEALIQKLGSITFSLEEESQLALPEVTRRARIGFDVEKVTKRFFDHFQKEHAAFLSLISGIGQITDRELYASVMLNRLMFVYFIQKKGFLDGDPHYLRNRLARLRSTRGDDKFYSFYRYFLLRLFHEGLGGLARTKELEDLIGHIPYLNGGIFDSHELESSERYGPTIQIPDAAFGRVFDFFDQYQWHLDERHGRDDNEINPDVLGYIFEKYINQKQMGAYYTKEDITGYIARTTVLSRLLAATLGEGRASINDMNSVPMWGLLRDNPDRYIHRATQHGITWSYAADHPNQGHLLEHRQEIPENIARIASPATSADSPNRTSNEKLGAVEVLSKPAPHTLGLPGETWSEVIARRHHYDHLRSTLSSGTVHDVSDLITLNLDISQFAQDAIQNCDSPELLTAFWDQLERLAVLDPTCGSGAFLFAALNVLEPLYEACLDRMEVFLTESPKGGDEHRGVCRPMRQVLERFAGRANRRYIIFKSIILNNLFGVDIMAEAVEICKLRLFLKLAAQVSPDETHKNFGIEPLPDIDFNIRCGNTLVGYATSAQVDRALRDSFDFDNAESLISRKLADLQQAYDSFRHLQLEGDSSIPASVKAELHSRGAALRNEYDRKLATDYGISLTKHSTFAAWVESHQPFHWNVEFYGVLQRGGFDVVLGNPPYVELSDIRGQYQLHGFELVNTGNLYAVCLERFVDILASDGRLGVIVPISAVSTPRMFPLMQLINERFDLHVSNFAVRPGKLFTGVDMNLSILLGKARVANSGSQAFSTRYNRWDEASRSELFELLTYAPTWLATNLSAIPKLGTLLENRLVQKLQGFPSLRQVEVHRGGESVYYHSGGRYFRKTLRDKLSNEYKELRVANGYGDAIICLMSSTFYYWLWVLVSDCYHVTRRDVEMIPVPQTLVEDARFGSLAQQLLSDLEKNATRRLRTRADGSQQEEVNYAVGKSLPIIDKIDEVIAEHFMLSAEERQLILTYDRKYRLVSSED